MVRATELFGILEGMLIDTIIGFSIVYKGFDTLGGFKKVGVNPTLSYTNKKSMHLCYASFFW